MKEWVKWHREVLFKSRALVGFHTETRGQTDRQTDGHVASSSWAEQRGYIIRSLDHCLAVTRATSDIYITLHACDGQNTGFTCQARELRVCVSVHTSGHQAACRGHGVP